MPYLHYTDQTLKRAIEKAKAILELRSPQRISNNDVLRHLLGLDPELAALLPSRVRRCR